MFAACALAGSGQAPQSFDYKPDFKALKVDASRLARIDSLLTDFVRRGELPHALTFVAKDGQVIHNKAFGWRDMESRAPLQKDDLFRMYSQTKAITTVALMTLYEQGKFQLDDPVSKYIPEMTDRVIVKKEDDGTYVTRKAASPVLIRHLLSHSSGITGEWSAGQPKYATLEEYVKQLVKQPLLFDPGTDWHYHPSADVWGYLVEYFSGRPLQEYVQEVILEPLGIKDMAYYFDDSCRPRFVAMYKKGKGGIEPVEMWSGRDPFGPDRTYAAGGTGLSGTIEGYARFCQMIANYGVFNGRRILGRRTLEIMGENCLPHPNSNGKDFSFGIGFRVLPEPDAAGGNISRFTPMPNPGSLIWGGMANTDYLIDRREGLIILLYTNRIPATGIWQKFLNTVYQVLE